MFFGFLLVLILYSISSQISVCMFLLFFHLYLIFLRYICVCVCVCTLYCIRLSIYKKYRYDWQKSKIKFLRYREYERYFWYSFLVRSLWFNFEWRFCFQYWNRKSVCSPSTPNKKRRKGFSRWNYCVVYAWIELEYLIIIIELAWKIPFFSSSKNNNDEK